MITTKPTSDRSTPAGGFAGRDAAVLGAGRQGICAAYDFGRFAGARRVTLLDADRRALDHAARTLGRLLPQLEVKTVCADGTDERALAAALAGSVAGLCALPYRFAPIAARAAIAARCSLVDLGGNTAISGELLKLHAPAAAAGVVLVPDTGLAPGVANSFAAAGVAALDQPEEVRIWCGGLPQRPIPPFGYRLVFSAEGLINEYSGDALDLQNGELVPVPTLSTIEPFEFPALGRLEAAPTSGGTSTAPETFRGRLRRYEYRTVRYPGHFERFRVFQELGLFGDQPIATAQGGLVRPRDLLIRLLTPLIDHPEIPDLVVLRVDVVGQRAGQRRRLRWELLDRQDPETGFTAMERCTAFPAAVIAEMAAAGEIAPGARPLESAAPSAPLLARLAARPLPVLHTEEPL